MSRKRRKLGTALKAEVALAAVMGDMTTARLSSEFEIHTSQVTAWNKRLLDGMPELFADGLRMSERLPTRRWGPISLGVLLILGNASCTPTNGTGSAAMKAGDVVFSGGHDTDPQDHGRPVVLIAHALDVKPEVFRQAFSGVTPSRTGPTTPSRARANKKVLMDALGKYGVTNDRLDEVSDYYRYNPQSGELWTHTPASATAIIQDGKVTGFKITNPGSGYTTPPTVRVIGYDGLNVEAQIEFTTDLNTNGQVISLTLKK